MLSGASRAGTHWPCAAGGCLPVGQIERAAGFSDEHCRCTRAQPGHYGSFGSCAVVTVLAVAGLPTASSAAPAAEAGPGRRSGFLSSMPGSPGCSREADLVPPDRPWNVPAEFWLLLWQARWSRKLLFKVEGEPQQKRRSKRKRRSSSARSWMTWPVPALPVQPAGRAGSMFPRRRPQPTGHSLCRQARTGPTRPGACRQRAAMTAQRAISGRPAGQVLVCRSGPVLAAGTAGYRIDLDHHPARP